MRAQFQHSTTFACSCGQVTISAVGKPIITASCFCGSCQEAAQQLSRGVELGMTDPDGGTPFVLYRKDRVHLSDVPAELREHRLRPESSTRRVVTSCCQTPMFLEFASGHWLSLYARRLKEDRRPPLELRTMTRDAPPGSAFSDDIPSPRTHSIRFMARLFWAWVLMGFRTGKTKVYDPVPGPVETQR